MSDTYDPYRNAVRRTLADKAAEEKRKEFIKNKRKNKKQGFFQKKFYLKDFIDLPEGLTNILVLGLFLLIPYFLGFIFTFTVLAELDFQVYKNMHNNFAFLWVIGYEFMATMLLMAIIKGALTFDINVNTSNNS